MLEISVNGRTPDEPPGPENWGELLDFLERAADASPQIVTAVRFGGVAVPTFREPAVLARDLSAVGSVEVETVALRDLLHDAARAAAGSVPPLTRAARRMADHLRGHGAPNRDFPALVLSVRRLAAVTAVLAEAVDPAATHGADCRDLVSRLSRVTDAVEARHAAGDWAGTERLLTDELMPTLAAWAPVVRRVWTI